MACLPTCHFRYMTANEINNLINISARIVVSLLFVGLGVWFVMQGGELRPIGTGFLGTVIGFWLK